MLATTKGLVAAFVVLTLVIGGIWALWAGGLIFQTRVEREVNRESQQYQDGTIERLRGLANGVVTGGEEQARLFTRQFCSLVGNVDNPPADIVATRDEFCS